MCLLFLSILFLLFYFFIFYILNKKTPRMKYMNVMQCKSQRQKKKNTKTKEHWSQRKSNEAQGPRKQNSSGTQNHTNYLTEGFKLTSIKRFAENVGILTLNRNILKTHNLFFNKIPNEVIPNLNVLSLRMLYILIALELLQ